MALHEEEERICRQLGNIEGLAYSLANQALLVQKMGRAQAGLSLVEQAYQLASEHGYAALAKEISPILESLRQSG